MRFDKRIKCLQIQEEVRYHTTKPEFCEACHQRISHRTKESRVRRQKEASIVLVLRVLEWFIVYMNSSYRIVVIEQRRSRRILDLGDEIARQTVADAKSPRMAVPVRVCDQRSVHLPDFHPLSRSQLTLHKRREHFATRLQQRVPHDNLQEPLQAFPPMLDHIIREPVRKHLSRQRGYRDAGGLALQDIAESLKLAVAAPHRGRLEFEGGNIRAHYDLVRRVHAPADAMGHGVANLCSAVSGGLSRARVRAAGVAKRCAPQSPGSSRAGRTAPRMTVGERLVATAYLPCAARYKRFGRQTSEVGVVICPRAGQARYELPASGPTAPAAREDCVIT